MRDAEADRDREPSFPVFLALLGGTMLFLGTEGGAVLLVAALACGAAVLMPLLGLDPCMPRSLFPIAGLVGVIVAWTSASLLSHLGWLPLHGVNAMAAVLGTAAWGLALVTGAAAAAILLRTDRSAAA